MKKAFLGIFLLTLGCAGARAQGAIYAGLSSADFHKANVGWQFGPTLGAYWDPVGVPQVRAGLDARGSWIGSGDSKDDSFMVGPRVQVKPHAIPMMPYAEILGGVSQVTIGQGSAQSSGTNFSWQFAAGVDVTFSPHLDMRAEYARADVGDLGQSFHPAEITTGLVLRLP